MSTDFVISNLFGISLGNNFTVNGGSDWHVPISGVIFKQ
jgi:hypothetical protein